MPAATFDGWLKGEYGDLGPRAAGVEDGREIFRDRSNRDRGFFAAKNMVRYRDALLGPRAGVLNLALTGLPNGLVKGMGFGKNGTWVVVGSAVYSFVGALGEAVVAYTMTDSITDTPTSPPEVADSFGVSYLVINGLNSYKIDHATKTVTRTAGAMKVPNGLTACFYQDRLIVGGDDVHPTRLYYSDPGSAGWDTFQALSYYDMPGAGHITGLFPFRNGLLVSDLSGSWVYITGVLGSTAVIRTLSRNGAPGDPPKGVALSNEILYMAVDRPYTERFNGAIPTAEHTLRFAGNNYTADTTKTPTYRALKLVGPDDFLFLSGLASPSEALNRALLHYDGVHTYHTWEKNIGAWARSASAGIVLLCKDGTAGTPPVFYIWNTDLGRPGFTGDSNAQPGDDSTSPLDAYLHLPQFFDPSGQEIMVRSVIVDFKKWNTGTVANNHFDVSVRAINLYQAASPSTSATQSFDEAVGSAATVGTGDRRLFGFGDQGWGSGFEVYIDTIKGCAVRSVTVLYDVRPARD